MSVFVDRAGSARTKCEICGNAIAKAVARIVEETTYFVQDDERVRRKYCHLECAVEVKPEHARTALIARETDFDAVLAIVEAGDAKLASEVREFRDREYPKIAKRVVALDDPQTAALIVQLEAAPQDRGLLAVLADHLQQQGDERGELIAIELAASMDPAAHTRRRELQKALSPELPEAQRVKVTWGLGFIRNLEVWANESIGEHAELLAHPSCRLLERLKVTALGHRNPITIPRGVVPRTVRELRLMGVLAPDQDLAALPHLESLAIHRSDAASHPTLRSLALSAANVEDIIAAAASFPAVRSLMLSRQPNTDSTDALERGNWFARLDELTLQHLHLNETDVRRLERGLADKKLARLEIEHCYLGKEYQPRLEALCEKLEFAYPIRSERRDEGPVIVEHTNKPEWGRGTILREADGKVEVEFASGKKTFKADAPFLKRITE